MLAECKQVWESLSHAARAPAGEEGVTRVVASRFPLFPQPERSPAEWSAWWSAYFDALEDLPEEALDLGMREYLRQPDAEFLPKPGRLRELARQASTPTATAAALASRCAAYTPARADHGAYSRGDLKPPYHRMPTAEERKREVAAARETCRQLAESAAKRQRPAYVFGVPSTDEHGISQAMREHLAQRSRDT